MGKTYKYSCSKCDYEINYKAGQGFVMNDYTLEKYLERRGERLDRYSYKKFSKILEDYPFAKFHISYRIYKCIKCGCLSSHKYTEISDNNKILHTTINFCPYCNLGALEPYAISENQIEKCPACNNKSLQYSYFILWD